MNPMPAFINRYINYIWLGLTAASALIVLLVFLVWNASTLNNPKRVVMDLENVHVDECSFDKHRIKVVGWAFTEGEPSSVNRVFAYKMNGEAVEVMSSVVMRPDVTRYFNKKLSYDRAGFSASKRIFNADDYSGEIEVISEDYSGVGHAKRFSCK
ncbi:TPA: hypothetical protein NHV44_000442 [Enterobacter cloacae]|uniref:hypothetical protein n=2 Tax=Enterobacter cloacae TaxID=550 RepID=UPI0021472DCE|nr:hypothetical protein [Enterobacter cloacae]HBM7655297.1 hypothetical protein [Enterobacter cloacae subsp. cloacae]MEA3723503.1 hypothetical protein [Enterobacter cloacae]MEA3727037.1 hypothetical protein [Enterobacter cloacae]MEA3737714.1 hypothetical protein [Enterobacter cloacae]MEA3751926.1 hypothetical protein [Enterobacter cloacae]